MNASTCCCRKASAPTARVTRPAPRRVTLTGWLLPGAVLVLMPKCPACLAAYLAMATGLGISLPTAANVRLMLIAFCIASLSWLALRTCHRVLLARSKMRS